MRITKSDKLFIDDTTFQPFVELRVLLPIEPFQDAKVLGTEDELYDKLGKEFSDTLRGLRT